MKKILFATKQLAVCLLTASILFTACKKDKDGSPGYKSGDLTFKSVFPAEGGGGTMVTISGTGFGDIRTIVFDKGDVPATFNPTLNSEGNIIFRVPSDVNGGPQNIVLTNGAGKSVSVPFNGLAFPVVDDIFPTDFEAGSIVTIKGNNLDDVTKVLLEGTTNEATVESASKKVLVIKMPASTISRAKLSITNITGELITATEMVNVDAATVVIKDGYVAPAESWSWGGTYTASTEKALTGSGSLKAAYDPNGTWGGLQIGLPGGLSLPTGTKYFSFWAFGADVDKNFSFRIDGNVASINKTITVPANKWTYFREDISSFGLTTANMLFWQINGDGKTIYFDNVMFFK